MGEGFTDGANRQTRHDRLRPNNAEIVDSAVRTVTVTPCDLALDGLQQAILRSWRRSLILGLIGHAHWSPNRIARRIVCAGFARRVCICHTKAMMLSMDPFRVLGVARDSTRDQVKAAFRDPGAIHASGSRWRERGFCRAPRCLRDEFSAILDRREGRKSAGNGPATAEGCPTGREEIALKAGRRESQQPQRKAAFAQAERIERKDRVKSATRQPISNWLNRDRLTPNAVIPGERWKWGRRLGRELSLYRDLLMLSDCYALQSRGYAIVRSRPRPPRYVERPRYRSDQANPR